MTDVYLGYPPPPDAVRDIPPPYNVSSPQYENRRQIAAGRTRLFGVSVFSSNVASQWIQLFDSAVSPANGAVPAWTQTVAGVGNLGFLWIPGRVFEAGVWICNSTTGPTLTAGAADTFFDCQWAPIL